MKYTYRNGLWYKEGDTTPLPDKYIMIDPWKGLIRRLDQGNELPLPVDHGLDELKEQTSKPKMQYKMAGYGGIPMIVTSIDDPKKELVDKQKEEDKLYLDSWVPSIATSLHKKEAIDVNDPWTKEYLKANLDYTNYRKEVDHGYNPLRTSSIYENILYDLYGDENSASYEIANYYKNRFKAENVKNGVSEELTDSLKNFILELEGKDNYWVSKNIDTDILDDFVQNNVLLVYGRKFKEAEKELRDHLGKNYGSINALFESMGAYYSGTMDYNAYYRDRLDKYRLIFDTYSLNKSTSDVNRILGEDTTGLVDTYALLFDTMAELLYGNYNSNKEDIINEGIELSGLNKDQANKMKAILLYKFWNEALALGYEQAASNLLLYLQSLKEGSQGFLDWVADTLNGAAIGLTGTALEMTSFTWEFFNPILILGNTIGGVYNLVTGDNFFEYFANDWNDALNSSLVKISQAMDETGMWLPSSLNKSKSGEAYTDEEIDNLKMHGLIPDDKTEQDYRNGVIRKNQGETWGKWVVKPGHEANPFTAGGFSNMVGVMALMGAVGMYSKGLSMLGSTMRSLSLTLETAINIGGKSEILTDVSKATATFLDRAGIITNAVAPSAAAMALDFGYAKSAYDTNINTVASLIYLNPAMAGDSWGDGEKVFNAKFLDNVRQFMEENPEAVNIEEGQEAVLEFKIDNLVELAMLNPEVSSTHTREEVYNKIKDLVYTEYVASQMAPVLLKEAAKEAATTAAVTWGLTSIPDAALFNTLRSSLFSTPESAAARVAIWESSPMQKIRGLFSKAGSKIGSKTPKMPTPNKSSQVIDRVTVDAGGKYTVRAKETTKGLLRRNAFGKVAAGGFISNYLQDVGVGINEGMFNTEWDNYINEEFNPKALKATKSVLTGALMGGLEALFDQLSFYDGMMGLGAGILTPRIYKKNRAVQTSPTDIVLNEDENNDEVKASRWNITVNTMSHWLSQAKDIRVGLGPFVVKDLAEQINESRKKYAATILDWLNNQGGDAYIRTMNHMYDIHSRAGKEDTDPELLNIDKMTVNAEYIALLANATFKSELEGLNGNNPIVGTVLKNLRIHADRGEITLDDIKEATAIADENEQLRLLGETPNELDERTASIINDMNEIIRNNGSLNVISEEDFVNSLNEITLNAKEQLSIYKDYIKSLNIASTYYKNKGIFDPLIPKVHAQTEAKIKAYDRYLSKHKENLEEVKKKISQDESLKELLLLSSTIVGNKLGVLSTVYRSSLAIDNRLSELKNMIADRKQIIRNNTRGRKQLIKELNKLADEAKKNKKKGTPVDDKEELKKHAELMATSLAIVNAIYGERALDEESVGDNNLSLEALMDEAKQLQQLKEFKHVINEDATPEERFLTLKDILNLNNKDLGMLLHLYNNYTSALSELQLNVLDAINEELLNQLEQESAKVLAIGDYLQRLKIDLSLGIENSLYFSNAVLDAQRQLEVQTYIDLYKDWGKEIKSYEEFVAKYELEQRSWRDNPTGFVDANDRLLGFHTAIRRNLGDNFLEHYLKLENLLIEGTSNKKSLYAVLNYNFDLLLKNKDLLERNKAKAAGRNVLKYLVVNLDKSQKELPKAIEEILNLLEGVLLLESYLKGIGVDLEGLNLVDDILRPILTYMTTLIKEGERLLSAVNGEGTARNVKGTLVLKGQKAKYIATLQAKLGTYATSKEDIPRLLNSLNLSLVMETLEDKDIQDIYDAVVQLASTNDMEGKLNELTIKYNSDNKSKIGAVVGILKSQIDNALLTGNMDNLLPLNSITIIPSSNAPSVLNAHRFTLASYEYHKLNNPLSHLTKLFDLYQVPDFLSSNDINTWRVNGEKPTVVFLYNPTEEEINKSEIQDELEDSGKRRDSYNKDTSALVAVAIELPSNTIAGNPIIISLENPETNEVTETRYLIIGFLPNEGHLTAELQNSHLVREAIDDSDFQENLWSIIKDKKGNPFTSNFEVKSTVHRDSNRENRNNPEMRVQASKVLIDNEENVSTIPSVKVSRYVTSSNVDEQEGSDRGRTRLGYKRTESSEPEPLLRPSLAKTINASNRKISDYSEDSKAEICNFNFLTKRLRKKIGALINYCKELKKTDLEDSQLADALTAQINSVLDLNKKSNNSNEESTSKVVDFKTKPDEEYESINRYTSNQLEVTYTLSLTDDCLVPINGVFYKVFIDGDNVTIALGKLAPVRLNRRLGNKGGVEILAGTEISFNLNDTEESISEAVGDWIYRLSEFDKEDNQGLELSLVYWKINTGLDFTWAPNTERGSDNLNRRRAEYRKLLFREHLLYLPPTINSATVEIEEILDTDMKQALLESNSRISTERGETVEEDQVVRLTRLLLMHDSVKEFIKQVKKLYTKSRVPKLAINHSRERRPQQITNQEQVPSEASKAELASNVVNPVSSVLGNIYDDICNTVLSGSTPRHSTYQQVITLNEFNVLLESANTLKSWIENNGMQIVATLAVIYDPILMDLMPDNYQLKRPDLIVYLPDGNFAIIDYKTAQGKISNEFISAYAETLNWYALLHNDMMKDSFVTKNKRNTYPKVTKLFLWELPLKVRNSRDKLFLVTDVPLDKYSEYTEKEVIRLDEGKSVPVVDTLCKPKITPIFLQDESTRQEKARILSILHAHNRNADDDVLRKLAEKYGITEDRINLIIKMHDINLLDLVGKTIIVNTDNSMLNIKIESIEGKDTLSINIIVEGESESRSLLEADFRKFLSEANSVTEVDENLKVVADPESTDVNNQNLEELARACATGGAPAPKRGGGTAGRSWNSKNRARIANDNGA